MSEATRSETIRLLLVEDNEPDAALIRAHLSGISNVKFELTVAGRFAAAETLLKEKQVDVQNRFHAILLDLSLPDVRGLDTVRKAVEIAQDLPIVVMTGLDDEELALKAVQLGAQDYLVKGQSDGRALVRTIRYAIERHRMFMELDVARERERFLATHDPLTGLPNRQLCFDRLNQAVAYSERYAGWMAVLYIDLDGFKAVNDTYGHSAADRVLQEVARRLLRCVRKSDTAARVGGDEFLILLTKIQRNKDAARVAEKILDALREPHSMAGEKLVLTPSIGIAVYPCDGESGEALIKHADTAMYAAKHSGKNEYEFYSFDMNTTSYRAMQLEKDLREAMSRNEVTARFSPVVDFVEGRVVGLEVMPEWNDPEYGRIGDLELEGLAGSAGLKRDLADWSIQVACEHAGKWNAQGSDPVRMIVNLDTRQLLDESFPALVRAVIRKTGIDPALLEFDVSESSLAHANLDIIGVGMEALRKIGCGLYLDDVGTGPALLESLRVLPVDGLKIGRALVQGIGAAGQDGSIIASLIAMARTVPMAIVAKGVETVEQQNYLLSCRCTLGQGPVYGEALAKHQVEDFLQEVRLAATRTRIAR